MAKTAVEKVYKSKTKWFGLAANFGISLAVRLYLIGVLLGGWLDRRFAHGNGYITIVMVVITIIFSVYMLYRDLIKLEKAEKQKITEGDGDSLE